MPEFMDQGVLMSWGRGAALLVIAVMAAKLAQMVLVRVFSSRFLFQGQLMHSLVMAVRRPLLWLLVFLALSAVLPVLALPEGWNGHAQILLRPLIIACFGWLVIGFTRGGGEWLEQHYPSQNSRDTLGTRRLTTQIRILKRVVISVIIILTLIGMAMVIPSLRQLGMSMFASAGVAGIVLGIAAKETLSNFIAGVQLALTQQILLGDEVIVNGEFGTIEEITSSYVIVRVWDLRRMVVPLRFFMENAFQNWTYRDPELIGSVFVYTDYTADVGALRAEAEKIVKQSEFWDGKTIVVSVTDCKESTLETRVIASGKKASDVWNLRCELREKLVAYLQREQPHALPRTRLELERAAA